MSFNLDAIQALKEAFGEAPGTDRFLIPREALDEWLFELRGRSARLHVETIGESTEGRDLVLATLSSSDTIAGLDSYRRQRAACTDTDLLRDPAHETGRVAGDKVIVLITAGIHATEVGGVQLMPELIQALATSNDPRILNILERAIILIVPSLNPDGMDLVHDWYNSTLGTPAEGTAPPALYHRYAGHDNNRDWYTHALQETRVVIDQVHRPWRPHVVLDLHQMGEHAPRYVLPPYIDPVEPHLHPLINSLSSSVGSFIASAHHRAGNQGVASGVMFDCYSPTRAYQHYHGGVRILAEAASARIATPSTVDPAQLTVRRGFDPRIVGVHNPLPWHGGTWRLRDIMDYHLSTIWALLHHVSAHADDWIHDQWHIFGDEVRSSPPVVHAIAPLRQQIDSRAAVDLIHILRRGDVDLDIVTEGNGAVQAGSIVVRPNQPFGSYARALLDLTPYPEMPTTPYDVTSHSLPVHMGVEVDVVDSLAIGATRPLVDADLAVFPPPTSQHADRSRWLAIDPRSHSAIRVVNHALRNGAEIRRTTRPHFDGGRLLQPGTWLIADDHALEGMSRAHAENVRSWQVSPREQGTTAQRMPRLGLYVPWMSNAIDTGWLRLVLEQSGFEYEVVRDADVRGSNLSHLDVLILAHQSPEDVVRGNGADTWPEEYAGGLGEAGISALRAYMQGGGTVIAIDGAMRALVGPLALPVRFPLASLPAENYACPGTVVKVVPDPSSDLMLGIAEPFPVMLNGKNALGPKAAWRNPSFPARFADDAPVVSGWMRGETYLKGLGAMMDEPMDTGRFVGFAFSPHFRAQMLASYTLLINAIMRTGQRNHG